MNCANHSDQAAVAFCRTCGKPLCNQCTRDVRGVIYCESCLAVRMEGAGAPSPAAIPGGGTTVVFPPIGSVPPPMQPLNTGPNPTVAGILGAIPIGLGAVYCGQYAKGLAHLGIVVLSIIGLSSDLPWYVKMTLGIFLGFFWVYQIVDAVRTARAIQMGEPIPDPFGLQQMFGTGGGTPSTTGQKIETKVPMAAAILIGLGVLFLINTAFDFSLDRYWPLILIVLGVYLFAKHWGLLATYQPVCVCERCRTRKLMGPAMLVTVGVMFLLHSISNIGLGRTWPAILLVIGVVKLVQSNSSYNGHIGALPTDTNIYPPTTPPPPGAPGTYQGTPSGTGESAAPSVDPSTGEVKNV